jgi:hypothetical protein
MIGRLGAENCGFGDEGTENVKPVPMGGVRGVGGASTMMMRSLRCTLWALLLGRWRWPSEDVDGETECLWCEPEWRWCEPPEERGGVEGNTGVVSIYSVVGSLNWIFRTGFSSVECVEHGLPGSPY